MLRGTTHVDFSFAYDRYAIFLLHRFASCERDAEVGEHSALRREMEIVCDESHSPNRGVLHDVMAHC